MIVRDPAALEALRPAWSRLLARDPRATPFQSPEWLLPWWRCFGPGGLFAVTWEDGGELAGLAPLFVEPRPAGARRLAFIGVGITDIHGVLAAPGHEESVRAGLREVLAAHAAEWDVAELEQLRPDDPLLADPPGRVEPQDTCYVVDLPARVEDYERRLTSRFASRIRLRYPRLLAGFGRVVFDLAGPGATREYLDALFRLHALRRSSVGGTSAVGGDPRMPEFHREVAESFARRGWLRLHGLRVDGALEGVLYAVHHRDRAAAYLCGFDPRLAAASPGVLMTHRALARAIAEGLGTFDFLRGDEAYKTRWDARAVSNARVVVRGARVSCSSSAPGG